MKFTFFIKERTGRQRVLQEQKGIFRTNCIDCLDRTNIVQTKIGMNTLQTILDHISQSNRINSSNEMSKFSPIRTSDVLYIK